MRNFEQKRSTDTMQEPDRRKEERRECDFELVVLLPGEVTGLGTTETFIGVEAWSQDISLGEISFRSQFELPHQKVLIKTDKLGPRFVEIEILRSTKLEDGMWVYGAAVVRHVSKVEMEPQRY